MDVFDLGGKSTKDLIAKIISGLVSQAQLEIQGGTGNSIFLVKNTPIINTSIDKAADSIGYHGIRQENVSNEKKFAHLCFWMLKLKPISYTTRPSVWGGRFSATDKSVDIPEEFSHIPVNTHVSFKTFVTLFCMQNYDSALVPDGIESIVGNPYSKEVMKSLRFHNYSARAMAMFLETLMMERLR